MTDPTIALKEYLSNLGLDSDADFLRQVAELLSQLLIDGEAAERIGAGKYERSEERRTNSNGSRHRRWELPKPGWFVMIGYFCQKGLTNEKTV
jgi:transposase-like protein